MSLDISRRPNCPNQLTLEIPQLYPHRVVFPLVLLYLAFHLVHDLCIPLPLADEIIIPCRQGIQLVHQGMNLIFQLYHSIVRLAINTAPRSRHNTHITTISVRPLQRLFFLLDPPDLILQPLASFSPLSDFVLRLSSRRFCLTSRRLCRILGQIKLVLYRP